MVVRTVLSRDTFELPELAPLRGREVEIRESLPPPRPPTPEQLAARHAAAAALRESPHEYDYEHIREQDLIDIADQVRKELERIRDPY